MFDVSVQNYDHLLLDVRTPRLTAPRLRTTLVFLVVFRLILIVLLTRDVNFLTLVIFIDRIFLFNVRDLGAEGVLFFRLTPGVVSLDFFLINWSFFLRACSLPAVDVRLFLLVPLFFIPFVLAPFILVPLSTNPSTDILAIFFINFSLSLRNRDLCATSRHNRVRSVVYWELMELSPLALVVSGDATPTFTGESSVGC